MSMRLSCSAVALTVLASMACGQVFTSGGPITIPDVGNASPYPSSINVQNGPTNITRISVTLTGVSHTFPGDLDILLVAPGGQTIVLLSDAGGTADLIDRTLTFADGFTPYPAAGVPTGEFVGPVNYGGPADTWPTAPTPSGSSQLNSLLGTSANGSWRLFVVDDVGSDSGAITSWSVAFNFAAVAGSGPVQSTMTYQGRLDQDGAPFTGTADLRYRLWSNETLSTPLFAASDPLEALSVPVTDGVFTVELPLASLAGIDRQLFLEVAVRTPAGSGDFTTLSPRQPLRPTAQSLYALQAETADQSQSAFALAASDGNPAQAVVTDGEGRVGVGIAAPRSGLHVIRGNDAALNSTNPTGFLMLGDEAAANVVYDNNEILARNGTGSSALFLNAEGGSPVVVGTNAALAGTAFQVRGNLLVESGSLTDPRGIVFGPFSADIGGSIENTDPMGLFRFNTGTDASVLFMSLSDDAVTGDAFQIGSRAANGAFSVTYSFRADGNAFKPGGGSWSVLSDPRAKHDIAPLSNTLDRLLNLRGYSYEYNADMINQGVALPGRQIGLMADEVERIFPDWITRDDKGTRFVTERSTTALMVEALRDLRTEKDRELAAKQAEIENLKARLDRLEQSFNTHK